MNITDTLQLLAIELIKHHSQINFIFMDDEVFTRYEIMENVTDDEGVVRC